MPSNNSTIAGNTLILYIRMFVVVLISLYTSRVILKTLGVENFGIYNIAGGLISLFMVINAAMSSSVQRFLNIELGKNDRNSFDRTFNTSIEIHILIAAIIFLLGETIGLYAYTNWINIPDDRLVAGHFVYQFSLLSTVVAIVKTPYNALIIARERMSFYAFTSIFETIAKLFAVLALVFQPFDYLIVYAAAIFCINIVVMASMWVYSRKKLDIPSFRILSLRTDTSKQMLNFSMWNFLGNISNVFSWQGINILLNVFLGVTVNAAVGVTSQVTNTISSFTSSFQVAYKPSLIQYYVKDKSSFITLVCRASRYSFFLLFMIVYPLYFNADMILRLWLDVVPAYSGAFVKVLLLSILISSVSTPLYNALEAQGRISRYQLATIISLPVLLLYVYIMLRCGFSPVWVMASHVFLSIGLLIVLLAIICRMMIIPVGCIFKNVFLPIAKVAFPAALFACFVSFGNGFADIAAKLAIALLLILMVGMSRNELLGFWNMLRKIVK